MFELWAAERDGPAAIDRGDRLQAASQSAIPYGHDNCDNITSIAQNGLTTSIT